MELTRTPDVGVPALRFVPADFDAADAAALEAQVRRLLDRPLASPQDLRDWIRDWSELGSMVAAGWARRMTAMNRDTRDAARREELSRFQREIMPAWQRHEDRLNHRYLESPHRAGLGEAFALFDREKAVAAEIFREKNTTLDAEDHELAAGYQELQGSFTVELDGKELTAAQCQPLFLSTDRASREQAFLAIAERRARDREAIDDLYDRIVALRHSMARNAGFDDYVGYRFAQMARFDYTPEDCARYHAAAEKVVVPALRASLDVRRERLGLPSVRPWDTEVSLFGNEPRTYFEDQDGYVALVRRLFDAINPLFAADFDILVRNGLLDLMSRRGKAPGAYNCPVEDIRLPFIFGNAAGMANDLRMLLHEGGHAFHTIACRGLDVLAHRSPPAEFAEVASMSMELFGLERLPAVFEPPVAREMTYNHLHGVLGILARVAHVDAFQLWVYRNPGHTREERRAMWLELAERYDTGIDWTGLEALRGYGWQSIPHLFSHALYFIEYGIAQLGALQMWRNERRDHARAVEAYRRALALGGSRPLPELFEAAELRFAMDEAIFAELVPEVGAHMERVAP